MLPEVTLSSIPPPTASPSTPSRSLRSASATSTRRRGITPREYVAEEISYARAQELQGFACAAADQFEAPGRCSPDIGRVSPRGEEPPSSPPILLGPCAESDASSESSGPVLGQGSWISESSDEGDIKAHLQQNLQLQPSEEALAPSVGAGMPGGDRASSSSSGRAPAVPPAAASSASPWWSGSACGSDAWAAARAGDSPAGGAAIPAQGTQNPAGQRQEQLPSTPQQARQRTVYYSLSPRSSSA